MPDHQHPSPAGYELVERLNMGDISALSEAAKRIRTLTAERDEARALADLGCDAADGGAHAIIAHGSYKFCGGCGETVKTPSLTERARKAESALASERSARQAAEAERERLREALGCVSRMRLFPDTVINMTTLNAAISLARNALASQQEGAG